MLTAYIHVPFCIRKCSYCGFYSAVYEQAEADAFIDSLRQEIELRSGEKIDEDVSSLYIGGGTPSILTASQLETLMETIAYRIALIHDAEITLEANPASLSSEKLKVLKSWGLTRLSLGVQSFQDDELNFLGRVHTAGQGRAAYAAARHADIPSVGLDLIYGIPGQSTASWRSSLEAAIDLRPDHLSLYGLSADAGSALAEDLRTGRVRLPSDEQAADMYETARSVLGDAGYGQYEISNFSLPGHECRHNLHYWSHGEYLGFGPSATSFRGNRRWTNVAHAGRYGELVRTGIVPCETSETLSTVQLRNEMVMLALRTCRGLDLKLFAMRFSDQERDLIVRLAKGLEPSGRIRLADGAMTIPPGSFLLSNEVISHLII